MVNYPNDIKQYVNKLIGETREVLSKLKKGVAGKEKAKLISWLKHTIHRLFEIGIYHVSREIEKKLNKLIKDIDRVLYLAKKVLDIKLIESIKEKFEDMVSMIT